jgi:chloramphenicol 3-O phosphotransferase
MNGTSSSGKTSISNELINQKEIPFHHLSIDDFVKDIFNNKFSDIEPAREVDEQVIAQIMFDPLISMYYSTIKLFSEMGLNVIVDTVIENDKWFNECLDVFFDQPTLFIGVICSKEELIRINTEEMNPIECAEKILSFIKSNKEYSVFKKLSKRNVSVS